MHIFVYEWLANFILFTEYPCGRTQKRTKEWYIKRDYTLSSLYTILLFRIFTEISLKS